MMTLRCDHPDILDFVQAKSDPAKLRHFNLSVLVTDAFIRAVQDDRDWPLIFPSAEVDGSKVVRVIRARDCGATSCWPLMTMLDPGVLFIDRINALNNLAYAETLSATNPCGEIPLPPYGACDLGSINLTQFVRRPFTEQAALDFVAIEETATVATRMLDNVWDCRAFRYGNRHGSRLPRGALAWG